MKDKIRKAVFVVVYRKNQKMGKIEYLLLRRKKHWKGWEFPKGGIEKGETLIQAVKREIKEETGQKPTNIVKYNVSGMYKYPKRFSDRPGIIGQNYTLFSAELNKEKVNIDKKEHSSYKWLSFEEAIKTLTHNNQKKCLKIVNKKLKNNKIKN